MRFEEKEEEEKNEGNISQCNGNALCPQVRLNPRIGYVYLLSTYFFYIPTYV